MKQINEENVITIILCAILFLKLSIYIKSGIPAYLLSSLNNNIGIMN